MNKNILIVDDDKRLRELLKDYLTEKNLQVYQSEDYDEAKEILSLVLFDLIILFLPRSLALFSTFAIVFLSCLLILRIKSNTPYFH